MLGLGGSGVGLRRRGGAARLRTLCWLRMFLGVDCSRGRGGEGKTSFQLVFLEESSRYMYVIKSSRPSGCWNAGARAAGLGRSPQQSLERELARLDM